MRTGLYLALVALVVLGTTSAGEHGQLKAVDSYCAEVEQFTQQTDGQMRRFGKDGQGWREYFDDSETFNDAAYVWLRKDKIVAVNVTQQSESGDWVYYVNHCFRPDGSLARVKAVFNTFHGNMSVEREMIFHTRGALLRQRTNYLDLKTRLPRKPGPDFIETELIVFKAVEKLPFLALLRPPEKRKPRPPTGLDVVFLKSAYTLNEEPQPQVLFTFGFSNLKPAPSSVSR